ncbi:MAG: histidine kinase [Roseivirga sp.]|nr:histidine kinase [Roseivirga sp.]
MAEKEERALRLLNSVPIVIMNFMFLVIIVAIHFNDGTEIALNFALQFYFTSIIVIVLYKKHIVRQLILSADKGKRKHFILLIVLVASGLLASIVIDLLQLTLDKPPLVLNILLWTTFTLIGLFMVSTSAYTHYYYGQKLNTVKADADKVKAELDLLKSQINPHFLFNTLNNIYGLVHMKDPRAPEMISQLSKILRYLLYDCGAARVSLRKEKELIENYLQLQSMKSKSLADRIDFYCDGLNDQQTIMPMLLINFVENCFKHSDIETNEEGWVTISLEVSDNELHFTTRNTVKQETKKKKDSGIGLSNTQKMLSAEYGEKHSLQAGMIDDFFEIDLKLELV